jgi:ferric-dicitrate binding protein FerR (iron transport regulator)
MSRSDIIYRVISGNATEEEREEVARWIAFSKANREEYEDLKLFYRFSKKNGPVRRADVHFEERFEQIRRRATMRLKRKARIRHARFLVGALVCVTFAAFLWGQVIMGIRPMSLQFQDQELRQVLTVVEREYGIEVHIDEAALESCRFTGTFHRVHEPEILVLAISDAINAHFERRRPGEYSLRFEPREEP